ncbi:MAG: hypothetical protein ACHBN1_32110 [Heteroscytonema crispum UTEX LB 1556]
MTYFFTVVHQSSFQDDRKHLSLVVAFIPSLLLASASLAIALGISGLTQKNSGVAVIHELLH